MEPVGSWPYSLWREQVFIGDSVPVVQSLLPADSHVEAAEAGKSGKKC